MTGAQEVFKIFIESKSDIHLELGMGTKNVVKGSRTLPFQLESGSMLRVTNFLWVPEFKRRVIPISVIEKKGFDVAFKDGNTLIKPKGYSSDKEDVFIFRETKLNRLKG
jgi:hypothetical protein